MKDPKKLMEAAISAVDDPSLRPIFENGVFQQSFCNVAAQIIFKEFGGPGFPLTDKGLIPRADAMYYLMADNTKEFHKIQVGTVQALANAGSLVFACMTSKMLQQEAGHVCVATPGQAEPSGKWGCEAPLCANVGVENFLGKKMSYAFRTIPDFFVWVPSL